MKDISNVFTLDYEKKIKILTGIELSLCIIVLALGVYFIASGIKERNESIESMFITSTNILGSILIFNLLFIYLF